MIPAPVPVAATADMITNPWPLQSHLELGTLPTAVPCARLHARQVLWEWRMQSHADTVELLVSELITNAVRASEDLAPGIPVVRLWLRSDRNRVVIQVWDGNDEMPVRQHAEPEAESGRGLLLVETLSAECGTYRSEGSSGKVAWAVVAGLTTPRRVDVIFACAWPFGTAY